MRRTIRLTNAINELGNALTAAEWPIKAVKVAPNNVRTYDTKAIYKDLVYLSIDMENMENDLLDCVNELCLKCGGYQQEHLGACSGCRWKTVKEGSR